MNKDEIKSFQLKKKLHQWLFQVINIDEDCTRGKKVSSADITTTSTVTVVNTNVQAQFQLVKSRPLPKHIPQGNQCDTGSEQSKRKHVGVPPHQPEICSSPPPPISLAILWCHDWHNYIYSWNFLSLTQNLNCNYFINVLSVSL